MVTVLIDISKKTNKELKQYMVDNDIKNKSRAIEKILKKQLKWGRNLS